MAEIAQLGERQTEDLKVPGSIPGLGIFAQIGAHGTAMPLLLTRDLKCGLEWCAHSNAPKRGTIHPSRATTIEQKRVMCPIQDLNLGCRGHNATS